MHISKIIKWILVTMGTILLALVSLFIFAYWYMSSGVFSSESFEKIKWHAAVSDENSATCYRGGMANDMRDNWLSKNMSEDDVIYLLGKPSGHFTKQQYQYSLGMCSGFGFDNDILYIYFDSNGYFSQANIIQH